MKVYSAPESVIWKYLLPAVNNDIFKSSFIRYLALFYISLYPLPRKMLKRYISASGKGFKVCTETALISNPAAIDRLKTRLDQVVVDGKQMATINIPQVLITHPNYRYSIGSFSIDCEIKVDSISIRLRSKYQYSEESNRITKYLHDHMIKLEKSGQARSFDISGDSWTLKLQELKDRAKSQNSRREIPKDRFYL